MKGTISELKNHEDSLTSSTLLNDINKKLDILVTDNFTLKKEVDQLKQTIEIQNSIIDRHEQEFRKANVIVQGVDEGQEVKTAISNIFNAICSPWDMEMECERVYRIGKPSHSKARPIRVILRDVSRKREILSLAKHLKTLQGMKNIFVNNDLTPREQELGKRLRLRRNEERSKPENAGKSIRIYRGAIYVNDVKVEENVQNFQ